MANPLFRPRGFLLAALALAVAACAGRGDGFDPFSPDSARSIRIDVLNNNFLDATLHAVRQGERRRLGIVTGKSEASYTMDWPMSLPLRIEIDLLAGGQCITRELYVDPGDILELQIHSRLEDDPDCFRR